MKVGRACNRSVGVGRTVADFVSLISERNWVVLGSRKGMGAVEHVGVFVKNANLGGQRQCGLSVRRGPGF